MGRLDTYLAKQNYEMALSERRLIQQNYFSALEKINYQSHAFACLVHSINGKEYNDISESGLNEIVKDLEATNIAQGQIKETVDTVKKK
jgi:hypothetical protein